MIFVILDPSGAVHRVKQLRPGATVPPGALAVVMDADWVPTPGEIGVDHLVSLAELGTMMQSGDWLVAQPMSPQPVAGTGQIDVPACAAGTVVEVYDMNGRELMDRIDVVVPGWSDTFVFPLPGTYLVELQAPAPAMMATAMLEVAP